MSDRASLRRPYSRRPHNWAGVDLERNVEMRTRDGVTLRSDIYRPLGDGHRPVLLHRTPYGKDFVHDGHYLHPGWYVRHGFVVVVQDVRGRFGSDGEFVPYLNELEDGHDTVEWAASLDGSNGRVGMYGASYPGMVQYLAAVESPPSLGAISPTVAAADLYSHWTYEGGALRLFVPHWTAALLMEIGMRRGDPELTARGKAIRSAPAQAGAWLGSAAPADLEPLEYADFYREWLEHPTNDAFWKERSALHRMDSVDCAVLHIGAWFDTFLEGALVAYRELAARPDAPEQWLILGPWGHLPGGERVGDLILGPQARGTVNLDQVQVEFFHRHLSGEAPEAGENRVRYYVLFENRWRDIPSWPPPGKETTLYLRSDGTANTLGGDGRLDEAPPGEPEPADLYHFVPRIPVAAAGGHTCCDENAMPAGPRNQHFLERLPEILVYSTAPFAEEFTLAGPVTARLWTATEADSADYVTRLCLVHDGTSLNISDGIRRMTAQDLAEARDEDGVAEVEIHMQSTAALIRPGDQLRLHVTSGAFPAFDVNPQTGDLPAMTPAWEGIAAMHGICHEPGRESSVTFTLHQGDGS